jgi:hypothetical protein
MFDWQLENLNVQCPNSPGIDLIDRARKLIVQVSATATKQKVESALNKDLSKYKDHFFKFIAISKDASPLRTKTFRNPHHLAFVPADDISDIGSLLSTISAMTIDRQEQICAFLKKEIRLDLDPTTIESNLAAIITQLAKLDLNQNVQPTPMLPYDIDAKILYNQLNTATTLIHERKVHYHRIDKIYSDFDKQGANKTLSVLNAIHTVYASQSPQTSPDSRFFLVIDSLVAQILRNHECESIPEEELRLYIGVLVVDAFIRCKIFEDPKGNIYAHS